MRDFEKSCVFFLSGTIPICYSIRIGLHNTNGEARLWQISKTVGMRHSAMDGLTRASSLICARCNTP